jgi:outer membrane lipoprotein-sorting protein
MANSLYIGLALLALAAGFATPAGAIPASGSPSQATSDAALLAEAVNAVRSISTMRADFVQTDNNGQSVSGVLTIKRPKKFRFQYQPNYPLLVVSDGRSLAVIDYEVRKVQRWPLHYTPVGALLDPGRDVSRLAHLRQTDDPNQVSVLIQDRGHREAGDMTLLFVRNKSAPGGLELAGWATVDAQNARTVVRVSHQQYGVEVSDDVFKWVDPRKAPRPQKP